MRTRESVSARDLLDLASVGAAAQLATDEPRSRRPQPDRRGRP